MAKLNEKKVGVAVYCTVCKNMKNPIGRDGGCLASYCTYKCPGYDQPPFAGSLWPMEYEAEFGYPVGSHGVEVQP